jgi:hypothetical protein
MTNRRWIDDNVVMTEQSLIGVKLCDGAQLSGRQTTNRPSFFQWINSPTWCNPDVGRKFIWDHGQQ